MKIDDYTSSDRALLTLLLRTNETQSCSDALAMTLAQRGWISLLMKRKRRGRKGHRIAGWALTRAGRRELDLFNRARSNGA